MIAAQNIVISLLVLRFEGRNVLATGFLGALLAGVWALFNGQVVDMGMLSYAQMGAGLLGVASKVPQVWTIYKQGGTGQLSAFAVSGLSHFDAKMDESESRLELMVWSGIQFLDRIPYTDLHHDPGGG